jgi:predicted TIM-barrel fold metal-dependent hydrolase
MADNAPTDLIDVHTHLITQAYQASMSGAGITDVGGFPIPDWNVRSALQVMDDHGISASLLSISAPGIDFVSGEAARHLARSINEEQSAIMQHHPTRFGALAILPLPDIEAALVELDHALGPLALDGVVLFSNIQGIYLGDSRFAPLFDELERRHATVLVHPTPPSGFDPRLLGYPAPSVEFMFESTRMVMSLVGSGTLRRCPNVRIIVPHGGGTVPYLANRIARHIARFTGIEPPISQEAALTALATLYYDLTSATHPTALDGLLRITTPDHLLFGSDFPFLSAALIPEAKANIGMHPGLDPEARAAIARNTAQTLFPGLAARM